MNKKVDRREYWKNYYQDNKTRECERKHNYYLANKGKISQRIKLYKEANLDQIKNYQTNWQRENKNKVNAKTKAYRDRNLEFVKEKCRDWYRRNKDYVREMHRKRKYDLSSDAFNSLWKTQNGICPICREPLIGEICVDHNHKNNRVRGLLHHACNLFLGKLEKRIDQLQHILNYLKENEDQSNYQP